MIRLAEGTAGARILAFGGYQPTRVVTNDELAQTSTPRTSGSATGSASPAAGSPAPDETVADMARRRGRQGAGRVRPRPRRHRPGHRRHLLLRATACPNVAARSPPGSASCRPARSTSTPPAPGSATRWPRPTTRSGPARPATCSSSAPRSCPDSPTGPTGRTCVLFGDGAGAAVVGPVPGPRRTRARASARWSGAATAARADVICIEGWRPVHPAGRPGGVPLGHHRAAPGGPAGVRAGRGRPVRPGRVRPAPGQPADHRAARRKLGAPTGRGRHATSSTPATPPRRRSRWRCPLIERGEVPLRRRRPAARLRRRPHLCGAGRRGTLTAPWPAGRRRAGRPPHNEGEHEQWL